MKKLNSEVQGTLAKELQYIEIKELFKGKIKV